MSTLYAVGQANGLLVAGTGNKVEDFGVGFYTKYGDGGVDVSPIADLYKTEVFELTKALGVIDSIQNAEPTDGLWDDERTDEGINGRTDGRTNGRTNGQMNGRTDGQTDGQEANHGYLKNLLSILVNGNVYEKLSLKNK